jgi:hypothetical protein
MNYSNLPFSEFQAWHPVKKYCHGSRQANDKDLHFLLNFNYYNSLTFDKKKLILFSFYFTMMKITNHI